MRARIVLVIVRRELRDVLRDRRTLFATLVLPLLLYPALMLGFTHLTLSRQAKLRRGAMAVAITEDGRPLLRGAEAASGSLAARILAHENLDLVRAADPAAALEAGEILLALDLPADLEARVRRGERVELAPLYLSSNDRSRAAFDLVHGAVESWREEHLPLVLTAAGDRATSEERGGSAFGGVLAMMIVLMALTGAFYPALDIAAGEKERGTLETLLLSPATRRELVAGKYLTVLLVALAAALANLGSMGATFSGFSSMIAERTGAALGVGLSGQALVLVVLAVAVLAALFAALSLALSTFARTYKEGQAYLTPLFMVVTPLAMTGMLPDLELDAGMALVPVANVVLLVKGLLAGLPAGPGVLLALASTAMLGGAALLWTVGLFSREEVLFREGKQVFGLRPPPGVPRPARPTAGMALFGLFLALAVSYHAGTRLADRHVAALAATMAGLAAVPLLVTLFGHVPLRTGLGLARPRPVGVVAGLLLGGGALALSLTIAAIQEAVLGPPGEVEEVLRRTFEALLDEGLLVALIVVSVLPGVAEELLFRGLALQGFRDAFGRIGAVAASAIAFGLFHMDGHRFLPQATMGVLAALLVLRSGSVLPAMLAHAVHNALVLVLYDPEQEGRALSGAALLGVAAAGIAFSALALRIAGHSRARASGEGPP